MDDVPDTCPRCGNDDLDTWSDTEEVGPLNSTGTLVGKPSPNWKEIPVTVVACTDDCGWSTEVRRDQGGC